MARLVAGSNFMAMIMATMIIARADGAPLTTW
jgi:hypothetical protein